MSPLLETTKPRHKEVRRLAQKPILNGYGTRKESKPGPTSSSQGLIMRQAWPHLSSTEATFYARGRRARTSAGRGDSVSGQPNWRTNFRRSRGLEGRLLGPTFLQDKDPVPVSLLKIPAGEALDYYGPQLPSQDN